MTGGPRHYIDEAELRDVPESVEPEQVAEPEPKR